jgi:hypothetical protein
VRASRSGQEVLTTGHSNPGKATCLSVDEANASGLPDATFFWAKMRP